MTGFFLGFVLMLSVAFFILGCIFAAFQLNEIKALGAFFLIQFFLLMGFFIYGARHRKLIYDESSSASSLGRSSIDPPPRTPAFTGPAHQPTKIAYSKEPSSEDGL
jgi:hypothetical protein